MAEDVEVASPSVLHVALSGEFDIARTLELREAVLTPLADQAAVVVDLSGVTFFDSTSLRSLLEVRNALLARGTTITLTNPHRNIARLFRVTGTDALFGLDTDGSAPS
jgi:anti-sigma B factor antagonist